MRRTPSAKRPLRIETLEDRCNPSTGVPWLDASHLTISFAPDGTDISGTPSAAFSLLSGTAQAAWQKEVLRAYQTWAVQTNLNIGLVADGGQPFGTAGAPQLDGRFGDLRIGARPLSENFADSLAGATGFTHAGGTWSGDVVLNTKFGFGIGGTAAKNDLFTVAVQEAGNALSLVDNPDDKASVMYPRYQGAAVTGLAASDVAAARALYGARAADAYEGTTGNGTPATAYDLTANGNVTSLTGDVTQVGDVDVYKLTTPLLTAATKLTIDLKAAGLSLFTGRVTVTNAANVVVGTAVTSDPLANDLSLVVANYLPNTTYYVRVEGSGTDVFSAGAYNLKLTYDKAVGLSKIAVAAPYVNLEGWLNNGTLAAAQPLAAISTGNLSTFAVGGLLTSATDVDWFKFSPPAGGTLTVSVWAYAGGTVLPKVEIYNAAGTKLAAEVVGNGGGQYTLQVQNQTVGGTYFARVAAADPAGTRATGVYVLGTNLGTHKPTLYDALSSGSLSAAQNVSYGTLTVGEARLTQFSLSAANVGVDAAVRMSIYNAQGQQVFTLVAFAGQDATTGAVWLPSGQYTVVYNAATRTGVALPGIAFTVRKWERSSPIDPFPIDPTSPPPPPPPGGQVTGTLPGTTPPVTPPPISNPYGNT